MVAVAAAAASGRMYWPSVWMIGTLAVVASVTDALAIRWAPIVRGPSVVMEGAAVAALACLPAAESVAPGVYLLIPPIAAVFGAGRRWAVAVVAIEAVFLFAGWWWAPWPREIVEHSWTLLGLGGGLTVAMVGAVVGVGMGMRAAAAATAASAERRRLGRELHDRVAQDLAGLALRADSLASMPSPVGARNEATEMGSEARRILRELRRCISDLRDDGLADVSLATALADHSRQVADSAGMTACLSLSEASRRLDGATELELLRIAQEALNNVQRHSSARNLWVDLRIDPPSATMCVADDGIGPPSTRLPEDLATGHGMTIMRERAMAIGAALCVTARPGGGTQVDVSLSAPATVSRGARYRREGVERDERTNRVGS
ncbi:MAG: histidine kinase [Candidatus Nanopelagicales bacterium]|nr:histidine kinase [Candidatus Nanopelagicales bacterium]MDZ4249078.1 histidine kinase [Candidatus Nanopelagicales bacterium]